MATAMIADIHRIEERNPNGVNILLCGGRDSLNMALLPWKRPTLIYSALPNFPLVQQFVADNGLKYEVRELKELDVPRTSVGESLEGLGRVDLQHFRWTGQLRQVASEEGTGAIFWKGQLGCVLLTEFWRRYLLYPRTAKGVTMWAWRRMVKGRTNVVVRAIDHATAKDLGCALWEKGAAVQGVHMGFLRAFCDCLVLSAYHGPNVQRVWQNVDLARAAFVDLRPTIGKQLLGRQVKYPVTNPGGPPKASERAGLHRIEVLTAALREAGIAVEPV